MNHTVEEVKLKNGAKGLLIDVPGATVMSMQFHFRAGSRYAKHKDIEQVAHIMEHMAFGANARFASEQAYDAEFTKNGAYHNAYTTDISMVYEADCADFEWDRILDLQILSIAQPKFIGEELEAEKGNVRSELTSFLDDHFRILWPRIQTALGEDVLTWRQSLATIPNVKLADIKEHHKRTHTTANMRFVIAGKLRGRKSEIIRRLENIELARGERFDTPHDILSSPEAPALIRRKSASNLTFGLAMIVPGKLTDDELDAMHSLNHILCGTSSSRIYGTARKRGLAYHVGSYAGTGFNESSWDLSGQVNYETADELFNVIADQMKRVLSGDITDQELEGAMTFSLGRYQMSAQTVSQISSFYVGRYFSDDHIKDYAKVPDMIRRVTKDKIVATANKFIQANTWVLAGVSKGDRDELAHLSGKLRVLFENKER